MPETADDQALIRAVAQGDDLALRDLFDRHAAWIASRLRRRLPREAAEDVLQETFVAAWRNARSYKDDGEVGAWLWGIAQRQSAMWLRKRAQHEGDLRFDVPARDDPARAAAFQVDFAQALNALGPPGSPDRELARLLWEEERPVAEVARWFGIPIGTVKSRAFKLRKLMRNALRERG